MTYCRVPLVLDPQGLSGADVAIVGAPFDLGTSYRPGARFAPRAIRTAEDVGAPSNRPHMSLGVDPFDVLRVVDYGDIEVVPDLEGCHRNLELAVDEVLDVGAVPVVLGGDHSLALPNMRALARRHGPEGYRVVHFDTHADTEIDAPGVTGHATPFFRAVDEGHLEGTNLTQIGLRGAWPYPYVFEWMHQQGITWYSMHHIEEAGFTHVLTQVIDAAASSGLPAYLTVDIDVLDPAFAPGTGTPEPGGLTTRELLRAVRAIATRLELCFMDIVEVCPPYDPSGISALAAHRVVLEALSGMAFRRIK